MSRQRDILISVLRNLKPGEEILCTSRSYSRIASRVGNFQHANPSCRFKVRQEDGAAVVRRVR